MELGARGRSLLLLLAAVPVVALSAGGQSDQDGAVPMQEPRFVAGTAAANLVFVYVSDQLESAVPARAVRVGETSELSFGSSGRVGSLGMGGSGGTGARPDTALRVSLGFKSAHKLFM